MLQDRHAARTVAEYVWKPTGARNLTVLRDTEVSATISLDAKLVSRLTIIAPRCVTSSLSANVLTSIRMALGRCRLLWDDPVVQVDSVLLYSTCDPLAKPEIRLPRRHGTSFSITWDM